VLVITNDDAGRTTSESVGLAIAELRSASDVELVVCGDASEMDDVLNRRGDRALVVVGGDGSLHTAVGHLWRRGEAGSCPVGLIPLGTGNDFARGGGIPLDPKQAARLILHGTPRPVDLITDDHDGVVVNAVHVGVGADAAAAARPLKPYLRIAAFPIGSVFAGLRTEGWRLRVQLDGLTIARPARKVLMVGLANAPTIAGGTAILGPEATPTDGVFDVTVSQATGLLARAGYALDLMLGRHPEREDVLYRTGRVLTVEGQPFYTNADGELTGPVTRRTWTIRPGAWRCFLP
jgi:diacylglycerol kinase (ATP)